MLRTVHHLASILLFLRVRPVDPSHPIMSSKKESQDNPWDLVKQDRVWTIHPKRHVTAKEIEGMALCELHQRTGAISGLIWALEQEKDYLIETIDIREGRLPCRPGVQAAASSAAGDEDSKKRKRNGEDPPPLNVDEKEGGGGNDQE